MRGLRTTFAFFLRKYNDLEQGGGGWGKLSQGGVSLEVNESSKSLQNITRNLLLFKKLLRLRVEQHRIYLKIPELEQKSAQIPAVSSGPDLRGSQTCGIIVFSSGKSMIWGMSGFHGRAQGPSKVYRISPEICYFSRNHCVPGWNSMGFL